MVERAQWRYRDPRSHRAILIDAGHLIGTCRTALNSINANYFVTHGLKEEEVEGIIGLDHEAEILLQAIFIE